MLDEPSVSGSATVHRDLSRHEGSQVPLWVAFSRKGAGPRGGVLGTTGEELVEITGKL